MAALHQQYLFLINKLQKIYIYFKFLFARVDKENGVFPFM